MIENSEESYVDLKKPKLEIEKIELQIPEPISDEQLFIQMQEKAIKAIAEKPPSKRALWITSGITALVVILTLIITLPLVFIHKKTQPGILEADPLIITIKRELNEMSRYQQVSRSDISIGFDDNVKVNKQTIYSDILFNIYDVKNGTNNEANLYYAYAIMNNMTMVTDSKSTFLGGLDLYEEGGNKNPNNPHEELPKEDEEEGDDEVEDNTTLFPNLSNTNCSFDYSAECLTNILSIPIVKFAFYENGTINEIFKPSVIETSMWTTLLEAIKKFTPALSRNLYDNKLRRLDNTETLQRSFHKEENNTMLHETSINQGGIDGIEIDSSRIKQSVDTIVDESQGKITNVSSYGESTFVTTDNVLDDISVNPDSPLSDIDKSNVTNTMTSGFDSLSTKINITMNLVYSKQEPESTDLVKKMADTVKYTLYSKNSIKENNKLRNLLSFPYKEYTGDLTKIPNKLDALRLLKMDNFLKPIELSYCIFKMNQLGIKASFNILLSIDIPNDKIQGKGILIVDYNQLEVFNFDSKANVKDLLVKAGGIVTELTQKINNLGKEVLSIYHNDWSVKLQSNTNEINKKLRGVFNIGERFLLFEDLKFDMYIIIDDVFESFVIKIGEVLANIANVLETTLIDNQPISTKLVDVLTQNVNDFYSAETTKLNEYNTEVTGYITSLLNKLNELPDGSLLDLDISIESQEAISKTISTYEKHLASIREGIIANVNNIIKESTATYNNKVGKIIDDILSTLTSNTLFQNMKNAESVAKAKTAMQEIRQFITGQSEILYKKIRITKDNTGTNPITKNSDLLLQSDLVLLVNNLKAQKAELIKKLEQFNLSQSINHLIKNLNSIQVIENSVKNTKIEAFKTYFNTSLIWNDLLGDINTGLKQAINTDLKRAEGDFQSLILAIKVNSSASYSELNDYINKELNPIKDDLPILFSMSLLTPILGDIVNMVSLSWLNAAQVFEENFKLANTYIIEVINDFVKYQAEDGGNLKYKTTLFQSNYEAATTIFKDFIRDAESKVNIKNIFNDVKSSWNEKIQQLKDNPSNEFAKKLTEFPFINSYFTDLDLIAKTFENYFNPFEENIKQLMANALNTFTVNAEKLFKEYNESYVEFDTKSIEIDQPCDLWRDRASEINRCHLVKSTGFLDKMKNTFEQADFTPDIKLAYDQLIDEQNIYIETVITSLDKIKQDQESFYGSLGDNAQLKDIISSWKNTAFNFEKQYLNVNLKNKMKKKIGDTIYDEGQKFIAISKKNINENTKAFYDQFIAGIQSFEYQPNEISYRLDQVNTFAQQNLVDLDTDINVFLMKSFDHSMSYYYHLMENEFTSSLNAFKDYFVLDINPIFKDTLQSKITTLIDDIKQQYQTNLQSVLMNNNPQDYWNLNWLKTQFGTEILPEFKSTIDEIKTSIEGMSKPEDNHSLQSTKIEQSITNTFKGSSTIIPTAEATLDTCLADINKETIKKSFEQLSSISFEFLKGNLQGLNNRLLSIESKIIKAYEQELEAEVNKYFSQDIVESTFGTYLETAFTFPFDTNTIISDIIQTFQNGLQTIFDNELQLIQQQPGTNKYLKRSFFVDLFNQHESDVYDQINQYIIEYLDNIYEDIKTVTAQKLNAKKSIYLANIDTATKNIQARPIFIFTNDWYATDSVKRAITQSKINVDTWFNNINVIIEENYDFANEKANKISEEVKNQLRIKLDWALNDLVNRFQLSETEPSINTSNPFNQGIESAFSSFASQVKVKIDENGIKEIILQRLDSVPLISDIFGDLNQFDRKVNNLIISRMDQMDSRKDIINKDVSYYLNYQLKFQSESVSSLLFGKDAYYTQLKDKCIEPYLNLVLKSTNSKINDMSDYVLSLLNKASSIKTTLVSKVPIIVNGFKTQMKSTVETTLLAKISTAFTSYLATAKEQMPLYYETTFTSVIKNSNFNFLSVIQESINAFDIRTIQPTFDKFFTEETTKAQLLLVTPLQSEITKGINAVLDNLTAKVTAITTIFDSKNKEQSTDTDELFEAMRTIISNHVTLISNPFTDYLFTINPQVQAMFNILYDRYAERLSPMTTIFSDIRTKIEEKVTLRVQQTASIETGIENEFTYLTNEVIKSHQSIKATIDSIRALLTTRVTSFEQDLFNKFFGLRRNTEVNIRETSEVYTISDINTALTSLKNTMNNIKALIVSTSNYSTISNAFTYYKTFLATGLKNIKDPINRMINIFNTILNPSFVNQFEATIDRTIADITLILNKNDALMTNEIKTALLYLKEYQYQVIDTLNANFQVLIDPQLNRLFSKINSSVQPIDQRQSYISTDSPNQEYGVQIMDKTILFSIQFTHHYAYGFNVISKDNGIYMSAYVEDYTEIQSKNAVKIGVVEYGGRVSGTIGQGRTSIGPYYNLNDFKVYLSSNADMTATTVTVYSYTITPRCYSVRHCKRRWYGKKKCWWELVWWNDKQEATRKVPHGTSTSSSWNRLY